MFLKYGQCRYGNNCTKSHNNCGEQQQRDPLANTPINVPKENRPVSNYPTAPFNSIYNFHNYHNQNGNNHLISITTTISQRLPFPSQTTNTFTPTQQQSLILASSTSNSYQINDNNNNNCGDPFPLSTRNDNVCSQEKLLEAEESHCSKLMNALGKEFIFSIPNNYLDLFHLHPDYFVPSFFCNRSQGEELRWGFVS